MGAYYWNTTIEDFKPEYLEALKEHCLSNYLPMDGGAWQNYSPRNYTSNERKKISSKRTKFYVAEYHPRIEIYDSPKFHNEKSYYEENDINDWWSCYKWGTERGMKFGYGVGWVDGEQIQPITSIDAKVFKIGLTNVKVKMRGGKRYKNIFIEKDITDLEIDAKDYESFIYAKLFSKYWKDKTFFRALKAIDYKHSHTELNFDGKTEAFRFKNVEDKLKIVREAIDQIENSSPEEIKKEVDYFCSLSGFWNSIVRYKKSFPMFYSLDQSKVVNWLEGFNGMYESMMSLKCPFLIDIGFKDKWLPKTEDDIKPLFNKPLEDFILPNSTHFDLIQVLSR